MRRLAIVLSSLLMVCLGLAPPAVADTTIIHDQIDPGPDAGYFLAGFQCDGSGPPQASVFLLIRQAPDVVPFLGSTTWGFSPRDNEAGSFFGVGTHVETSSELQTFQMHVRDAAPSTGRAMIFAAPPATVEGGHWRGLATVSSDHPSTEWGLANAAQIPFTWREFDASWTPTGSVQSSVSLAQFLAAKGGESTSGYDALIGFGCDAQRFFWEAFAWGSPGSVTTIDGERLRSITTMLSKSSTTTAGRSVSLRGTVDVRFSEGAPLDLEMRAFGSSTWSRVTTVTSDPETAIATLAVRPLRQTSYRWRFQEVDSTAGSVSGEIIVKVRTALTAKVLDNTLKLGKRLVVKGKTTPAKPGAKVKLYRKTATGKVKIATGLVASDGTYRVKWRTTRRGTMKVFTTIAAQSGNLAGTSPKRKVIVR